MREFKFRAWCEKHKVMIYNIRSITWNEENNVFVNQDYKCAGNEILMQYTGLKDIRGKEIYEGCIIRHKNPKPFKDSIYKVVFLNGGFTIKNSDYAEDLNEFLKYSSGAEVIGNIYEDSELLYED